MLCSKGPYAKRQAGLFEKVENVQMYPFEVLSQSFMQYMR